MSNSEPGPSTHAGILFGADSPPPSTLYPPFTSTPTTVGTGNWSDASISTAHFGPHHVPFAPIPSDSHQYINMSSTGPNHNYYQPAPIPEPSIGYPPASQWPYYNAEEYN
jgi:hypothetical protein